MCISMMRAVRRQHASSYEPAERALRLEGPVTFLQTCGMKASALMWHLTWRHAHAVRSHAAREELAI